MRRFAFALAVASLLGCSLALADAASPPGAHGTQTAPPPSSSYNESTGASHQTGESTAEHADSGKHMSYKACSKQARTKHLKGADRKQFIKDCEAGKSTD